MNKIIGRLVLRTLLSKVFCNIPLPIDKIFLEFSTSFVQKGILFIGTIPEDNPMTLIRQFFENMEQGSLPLTKSIVRNPAPFLRHPPLDPASPLFKIFVSPPLFSVPPCFKVFQIVPPPSRNPLLP